MKERGKYRLFHDEGIVMESDSFVDVQTKFNDLVLLNPVSLYIERLEYVTSSVYVAPCPRCGNKCWLNIPEGYEDAGGYPDLQKDVQCGNCDYYQSVAEDYEGESTPLEMHNDLSRLKAKGIKVT